MNTQPTLHEMIAAHPRMAHSEWMARNPTTTLQERDAMFKRFERIGQIMLDDWNSHSRSRNRERYPIPGESDYESVS